MATKKAIEKRKARNLEEMARRIELICQKLGIEDDAQPEGEQPEGEQPEAQPSGEGQPKGRKDRK